MKRAAIVGLALLLSAPAFARELPAFYRGIRPLGMGGAFTAVADDENALFYNPAGLDRVETLRVAVLNPLVEINEDGVDFYKDARDTDFNDVVEVTQLLQDHVGDYLHARSSLFPNVSLRHYAVGVLGQATVNAQVNNTAFPELQVNDALITGSGHFGTGWGFFDGVLRVGGGIKYVTARAMHDKIYTSREIASDDFEDEVRDDLERGSGLGFDVGAMVEVPVLLKPTFAVMVENVGDLDLGDAGRLEQQVNVGVSVRHSFSWVTLTGAADYSDVLSQVGEDDDAYKRIHFGLEARLWKMLFLRAGYNQGYATFGASLDFPVVRIDYANYAEEIGSSAGDRCDRRHVFQLTFGW